MNITLRKIFTTDSLLIGLAMFSMFFGAGNVIFPLALGQYAGAQTGIATFGLILTAAVMPIAGVIAMILFDGNSREFFGRLGKIPGFLLAFLIIALLGPLGSTPRCIALSYTTLKSSGLELPSLLFSALACGLIFLCTFRKNQLLTLLGWVLTPLLLTSLLTIICMGLFNPAPVTSYDQSSLALFLHGLKEGYNTMDLLAAFFFSSAILSMLKLRFTAKNDLQTDALPTAFRASLVGALLLTLTYIGFSYLAAFHGELQLESKDQLLAAITLKIAGPYAGLLVCSTIALACLTTAIALVSAFTDFLQKEVFKEKISYTVALLLTLLLTFFISTFQFTGIAAFLSPILEICYPGLIVLTVLNIAFRLFDFKPIKIPVFATFALSLVWYYVQAI